MQVSFVCTLTPSKYGFLNPPFACKHSTYLVCTQHIQSAHNISSQIYSALAHNKWIWEIIFGWCEGADKRNLHVNIQPYLQKKIAELGVCARWVCCVHARYIACLHPKIGFEKPYLDGVKVHTKEIGITSFGLI